MKMFNWYTKLSTGLRAGLCFVALFVLMSFSVSVWAATKGDLVAIPLDSASATPPLFVTLGKAEIVQVEGDVSDILVADPNVVDVKAVQANRIYVVGLNVGDTNLIALDSKGEIVKRLDVHVKYDLQAIQSYLGDLFPNEEIKVGSIHDQVVLTGAVSTPEVSSRVSNILANYVGDLTNQSGTVDELISNLLDVRGEQQVMLQVKIVEATRSVLKELGLDTNINDGNELSTTTIFGTNPRTSHFGSGSQTNPSSLAFATGGGIASTAEPAGILSLLADTGINGLGTIGVFLNALEEENLVNILAEPNLTAVSGEQAGFLAGGEFPVPVGRDQVGNLVIEFREFGVSLNFKPVVLSDERISLQLNTEVSSLDFESAIVLAQVTVPGLDIRRAETTVEIPSGGSLMIAGLLQSEAIEGMAGLPGIRKTPVLGDLVSSDSFQRDETELVVIVTPYLVEPYAERDKTEKRPKQENNPLSQAFVANLRRSYDEINEDLITTDDRFGYILD